MANQGMFTNLSFLRIFLGLAIVFYHLPAWTQFQRDAFVEYFYLFNDVFFCLSGYLMFHNFCTRMQVSHWKKDVIRRIKTLYPLHFIMLCVWTTISVSESHLAVLFGLEHSKENNDSPLNFFRNLTFIQGWSLKTDFSFNHPAWVFSVLLLCYICARLILLIPNKILVAGVSIMISGISFIYMVSSNAESTHGFSIPRVFLGFFIGGIFGLISRAFEPSLIQVVFLLIFCLISIGFMLQHLEEKASFFITPLISLLIWLSTRKHLSKSLKPNSQLRLKYFDRLTFSVLISHSLPIIVIEHLCIVIIGGPTQKLRGIKYIELSNMHGIFFILVSLLFTFVFAIVLHRLDQVLQQSRLLSQ